MNKGGVKKGHDFGGIRTLDDLRSRCYVDEYTDCWEWRLGLNHGKYPKVSVVMPERTYITTGVRAALILAGVKIPQGHTGYHYKCTNHKCVNPDHLKAGTHKEKWAHVKASGWMKGDPLRKAINVQIASSVSKLSPYVDEIRASDESATVLAARFNCSVATIRGIRAYRSHKRGVANSSVFAWRPPSDARKRELEPA